MNRTALTLACTAAVGAVLTYRYPFPVRDALVQIVLAHSPYLFYGMYWTWHVMMFTTPSVLLLWTFSFAQTHGPSMKRKAGKLPPFPAAKDSEPLHVVIGELHHPLELAQVEKPRWSVIPDVGLFTGLMILGAKGGGKTSGAMYPFAQQILSWRASDPEKRVSGITLEVKGDFCYQIKEILQNAGRPEDYIELSTNCQYRYNPLHSPDLDAFSLAYGISNVMTQLFGRSKDGFWPMAYTNLIKFVILLYKTVDDYVTLFQVYEGCINPAKLQQKLDQGAAMFANITSQPSWVLIDPKVYLAHQELSRFAWEIKEVDGEVRYYTPKTDAVLAVLDSLTAAYTIDIPECHRDPDGLERRLAQYEAVKRWYEHDWMGPNMHDKLRGSIAHSVSSFLSQFDVSYDVKKTFCPPKECYDPVKNADGKLGTPLPPMEDLIENGRVLSLNFPTSINPATARILNCLLKLNFQRAMLCRIPRMAKHPERHWREVLFLADEYHEIATAGESDPSGDDRFFALSRQPKCIPIVATQSVSSLKSALPGETWRTICQNFRSKIFLATSDDFTAKFASEYCGPYERFMKTISVGESGQATRISALTGKALAHKAGLNVNMSYAMQMRPIFPPNVFTMLRNFQAVTVIYDGKNPLTPTLCYLKPYYLPRETSYFEQMKAKQV